MKIKQWFDKLFSRGEKETNVRDTIEVLIEENPEIDSSLAQDERDLLTNILKLRDLTVEDVMIPRAEISAIDIQTDYKGVVNAFEANRVMRLPVYKKNLDDILGYIHMRDLLTVDEDKFSLKDHIQKIDFVAPSMQVLELLLLMRSTSTRLALVVDEYGGVDGLVTLGDIIEEIVGDIEDVADQNVRLQFFTRPDGVVIVDARMDIEDLEEKIGPILSREEREEDIETLGGLLCHIADCVPQRGELIKHEASGIEFEVIEANPRLVKRVGMHNMKLKADV